MYLVFKIEMLLVYINNLNKFNILVLYYFHFSIIKLKFIHLNFNFS